MPPAYFDHAATAPVRPSAVAAMVAALEAPAGNPSGGHRAARAARAALDDARDVVAGALGCDPSELVFTSGGTEADNAAVGCAAGRRVVTTAVEHDAVLAPARRAGATVVGVDRSGVVDLDRLASALGPEVGLVSVMLANNEVGTVEPLAEVAALVEELAPGATLHTDAVQALPWLDVAALAAPAALVSVSAHKVGGPPGIGALVVRRGTPFAPLILGGGQEHDRRAGTQAVALAAGFAAAVAEAVAERPATVARVGALRDRLVDGLVAAVDGCTETVPRAAKVAGNAHVLVEGVDSEALLFLAEADGVLASAGSSCASGAAEPSHVLAALGVDGARARGALRLTLGATTTAADVDLALHVLPAAVARLRRHGGG